MIKIICCLLFLSINHLRKKKEEMTTLDDRLLGEKLQNYCSSSEDEGRDSDDEGDKQEKSTTKFIPESELKPPNSSSGFTENVRD
jgi:hypothetical protein